MSADKDTMRRVDMKAELPNMSSTDKFFLKQAEQFTVARGLKQQTLRKKNLIVAAVGLIGVAAIYTYTLTAVKQEKFLDDYDDMHKK